MERFGGWTDEVHETDADRRQHVQRGEEELQPRGRDPAELHHLCFFIWAKTNPSRYKYWNISLKTKMHLKHSKLKSSEESEYIIIFHVFMSKQLI